MKPFSVCYYTLLLALFCQTLYLRSHIHPSSSDTHFPWKNCQCLQPCSTHLLPAPKQVQLLQPFSKIRKVYSMKHIWVNLKLRSYVLYYQSVYFTKTVQIIHSYIKYLFSKKGMSSSYVRNMTYVKRVIYKCTKFQVCFFTEAIQNFLSNISVFLKIIFTVKLELLKSHPTKFLIN